MLTSKHIKLFTSAFLVAMALSSCHNLDETKDSSYGYLTISGFDVDIQVEQLVPTKAGETTVNISEITGYSAPELASVTVVRKDDPSKTYTWNAGETLSLPAGTYTLSATDGTNAFDAPYFEGTGEVDVTAGNTSTGTVIFTLGNSVMKVTMEDGFNQHFTPVGENPVTTSSALASANAKMNEYVFIPSGTQLTVHIDGKNSAGVEKDFAITTTAERNTAYDVVLSAAGITMPSITLPDQQNGAWGGRLYVNPVTSVTGMSSDNLAKIVYEVYSDSECNTLVSSSSIGTVVVNGLTNGATYYVRARVGNLVSDIKTITVVAPIVTNTHYNDSDGNLAGTNAVLDLQLNDFLKEKVEIGDVVLSNGDTQMRTATASGTMDVTNNWPYLPQGNGYILTIPHKLEAETSYTNLTMSKVEVPAPTFNVVVSAETSYSRYLNYKEGASGYTLELANTAGSGDDIMNICAKVGISGDILSKSHYQSLLSYSPLKYDTNTDLKTTSSTVGTLKAANLDGQSWQKHTISASFTFDEVVKSSSIDCHVTGLPYMASPPTNSDDYGWSSNFQTAYNKIEWNSDGVRLEGISKSAKITSPSFYVPTNINTTLTVPTRMRTMSVAHIYAQSHLICRLSGTEVINRYGIKGEKDWKGSSDNVEDYTGKGTGTLTTSNSTIDIENEYKNTEAYIYIYSVKLDYR